MASKVLFSYVIQDTNGKTQELTGNSDKLIRHFSDATVVMTAVPGVVLNLDACIIRNGDKTVYGQYGTIENVASNKFILQAEDDEGNFYQKTLTADMVNYKRLTCNVVENRPDASGKMTVCCYGDYFNGSFGATDNTLTVQYRYRKTGSSTWGDYRTMDITLTSGGYVASATLTGLDYESSYDFEFTATDKLETAMNMVWGVKGLPVFHWSENDVTFEVPVNFKKGASGIKIDNLPEFGLWNPSLPLATAYASAQGWYIKAGNVVTVGFYVKADCISGAHTAGVYIDGLPFTPRYRAAGGGMCSGAYMSANHNFQCFVAETDNTIRTQTQACDSTSGGNLSTSASGCCYPYGGGELTLSGTITYYTLE